MFGQARPVVFDPYRHRRGSRWRLPRWLVLLLVGITLGAAAVIVVEQRYLPPRLSFDESTALRQAFEQADADRQALKADLATTRQRLDAALASDKRRAEELATSRAAADGLRSGLASLVALLPPDPRGGDVQVRAGRFSASAGKLAYDLVLTRPRATGRPLDGVLQFVVTGASQGKDSVVTLPPVTAALGSQEVVSGSVRLPDGFTPRQTTVQVLDRAGGRQLGMRVMLVN